LPLAPAHDYLDFNAKDHDYKQPEEQMGKHLLPPVDEPVEGFPPAY
jgi:hypothetical protein